MIVSLIGLGGGTETLSPAAGQALSEAKLIAGAPRLLEALPAFPGKKIPAVRTESLLELLTAAAPENAAVVFSGDTGFYSGATALIPLLRERGIEVRVFPGLSSLQLFAARLERPWQNWDLCSMHGTDCDILAELRKGRPVFLLTGGEADVRAICRRLADAGLGGCRITVGERLSYPDEKISRGTAAEMTDRSFAPLNVLLAELPAELLPERRSPGLPDDSFLREKVPMTKQEVRAAALAKLAVTPEDVCWDIGAGTGSVSVELALAGKEVWAVEKEAAACELIRRNREWFRAWNLHVTEGAAPEILEGLPRPDVVFVGGSGGFLEEILDAVHAAAPEARLCISAIALETLQSAAAWLEAHGLEPEITQISVSRTRKAGDLHLLLANNPVFLITGTPAEHGRSAGS